MFLLCSDALESRECPQFKYFHSAGSPARDSELRSEDEGIVQQTPQSQQKRGREEADDDQTPPQKSLMTGARSPGAALGASALPSNVGSAGAASAMANNLGAPSGFSAMPGNLGAPSGFALPGNVGAPSGFALPSNLGAPSGLLAVPGLLGAPLPSTPSTGWPVCC